MTAISPVFDWYTILLLLGVVQGYFISYFFLSDSRNKLANLFLGLLILVFTLSITETFLNYSGLLAKVLHLSNFSEPLQLLLGPLLYLYFRALINRPFRKLDVLHFLPFLLFSIYLYHEFSQPLALKYNRYIATYFPDLPRLKGLVQQSADPWQIRPAMTTIGMYLQLGIYLLVSAPAIRQLATAKTRRLAPEKRGQLQQKWLRNFALILLAGFALFLMAKNRWGDVEADNVLGLYVTFFLYVMSYSLLRNSAFLDNRGTGKKYENSPLSEEWMERKTGQLAQLMASEQPFLDNQFALADLAKKLAIPEHHLSQLINDRLGTNFFGLLNDYRTAAAKTLLDDPQNDHLKVEQIAYDVGYNSKSSFYTAFKKRFGKTPHAYRQTRS